MAQKDASWGERLLAKESEGIAARGRADEIAGRFSREEEARQAAERRGVELERAVQDGREEAGRLTAALRDAQKRLGDAEVEGARLEREKTEYERLSTAQAAQIHGTQEALDATRLQLAREAQLGKIAQNAKEQTEKALASQRQELARALQAQKAEFERLGAERAAEVEAAVRMRDDAMRAAASAKGERGDGGADFARLAERGTLRSAVGGGSRRKLSACAPRRRRTPSVCARRGTPRR